MDQFVPHTSRQGAQRSAGDARMVIYSLRRQLPQASRVSGYEFEDVVADIYGAQVISPPAPPPVNTSLAKRAWRRVGRRAAKVGALKAQSPVVPSQEYDLLLFACETLDDLKRLGPLEIWKQRCGATACVIAEVWAHSVPRRQGELDILAQFDHVFLHCEGPVDPVSRQIGRAVHFLPAGVDALRFCPAAAPKDRTIDIYSMGRRGPRTHRAMLEMAQRRHWFYLYDSFDGNHIIDPEEHRSLQADLIGRSRYFVVNKAKVNCPDQTHGEEELGYRFFEGAAAGAILIGDPPKCDGFRKCFDWPDAVITMTYNTDQVAAAVDPVEADPVRVQNIRHANMVNTLHRHDWLHRWETMLAHMDLPSTEAMAQRRRELEAMAERIDATTLLHNV